MQARQVTRDRELLNQSCKYITLKCISMNNVAFLDSKYCWQ